MKITRCLATMLVACLIMSGCSLYREPPGVNTRPVESDTPETAVPTTESLADTEPDKKWEDLLTYAEYLEMTAQERSDFADSFADSAEFFQWLKAVKEIYEQEREENELGQDGVIDMDKINPNG